MKNKNFTIALGGILVALTVISIYVSSIVPGIELTMYAISSIFVAVMVIESGPKGALLVFAASLLLGFIIIPNKVGIIPYAALFGYYGIIKYYIEKIGKMPIELIIKAALFLVIFGVGISVFGEVFLGNIQMPDFPIVIIMVGGTIGFLLYDRIYSGLCGIYFEKISPKIRK